MGLAEVIVQFWEVISTNLVVFIVFGIAIAAATAMITRFVDSGALNAARERLAGAQDQLTRLNNENDELRDRLEQHADDMPRGKSSWGPSGLPSDGPLPIEEPRSGLAGSESSRAEVIEPESCDSGDDEAESDDDLALSDDEEELLKLLADEEGLEPAGIAFALDLHEQKVQYLCDRLLSLSMIDYHNPTVGGGLKYELSHEGRRYLVEWGLLD